MMGIEDRDIRDAQQAREQAARDALPQATPQTPGSFSYITPGDYSTPSGRDEQFQEIVLQWNNMRGWSGVDVLGAQYGLDPDWWPGLGKAVPDWYAADIHNTPGSRRWMDKRFTDTREPWAAPGAMWDVIDPKTGTETPTFVRYDVDQGFQQYRVMSGANRELYSQKLVDAGLLSEEYGGLSEFTAEGASAFTEALRWANWGGESVDGFLKRGAEISARGGGGGGAARRYTIEVPDYDTLLVQSKNLLRQQLGRDPKDWEMSLIADEYKKQYGQWASAQKRKALGGNGTYEVPDPQALTQEFFEKTYENEISRMKDVSELATNNQILIGAATMGARLQGSQG